MRDPLFPYTTQPRSDDRRRPPYFERSENAAPIRRSSDGQAEAKPKQHVILSFHVRSSGCEISFYIFLYSLSAKIGDGRHISTRRGEAAHIRRSSGRPELCLTEYRKRVRQGRHISTRRGERGHLFAERAS